MLETAYLSCGKEAMENLKNSNSPQDCESEYHIIVTNVKMESQPWERRGKAGSGGTDWCAP